MLRDISIIPATRTPISTSRTGSSGFAPRGRSAGARRSPITTTLTARGSSCAAVVPGVRPFSDGAVRLLPARIRLLREVDEGGVPGRTVSSPWRDAPLPGLQSAGFRDAYADANARPARPVHRGGYRARDAHRIEPRRHARHPRGSQLWGACRSPGATGPRRDVREEG